VSRAENHDLGLTFLDKFDESVTVGLAAEDLKLRVFNEMDLVGTRLEKLLGEAFDVIAHEDGRKLDAESIGEFTPLSEKFARNIAQLAVFLFGKNPNFAAIQIF
jgi:hypothetical protein